MIDLDFFFSDFSSDVTQFWEKFVKTTFIRQADVPKRIGIWQFRLKYSVAIF